MSLYFRPAHGISWKAMNKNKLLGITWTAWLLPPGHLISLGVQQGENIHFLPPCSCKSEPPSHAFMSFPSQLFTSSPKKHCIQLVVPGLYVFHAIENAPAVNSSKQFHELLALSILILAAQHTHRLGFPEPKEHEPNNSLYVSLAHKFIKSTSS